VGHAVAAAALEGARPGNRHPVDGGSRFDRVHQLISGPALAGRTLAAHLVVERAIQLGVTRGRVLERQS